MSSAQDSNKKSSSIGILRRSSKSEPSNVRQLRRDAESLAKAKTNAKGKVYKSPYYDPVARHERYMKERKSLGIGKSKLSSSKASGSGRSSGSSGSGRSSGSSGSGRSSGAVKRRGSSNIGAIIQKLREESSLETDAKREAARRKIADLREELSRHVEELSNTSTDSEEGVNSAEIRGKIQSIRDEIEKTGGDLQSWISEEREALEKRIAAIYSSHGQKYKASTQADKKQASQKRDKEVNSRADAIYKSNRKM